MNYWNLIPWGIAFLALIVSAITLAHNSNKDKRSEIEQTDSKFDGIKESLLKANMKLDQVCSTTNETRTDIKAINNDMKALDTRVVVLERDMKTAFNAINEIKKETRNNED